LPTTEIIINDRIESIFGIHDNNRNSTANPTQASATSMVLAKKNHLSKFLLSSDEAKRVQYFELAKQRAPMVKKKNAELETNILEAHRKRKEEMKKKVLEKQKRDFARAAKAQSGESFQSYEDLKAAVDGLKTKGEKVSLLANQKRTNKMTSNEGLKTPRIPINN